jgi:hypothetical protein
VKTFLVCLFIASIALCVLALLVNVMALYYIGAVLAILTGCAALTGTWLNDLLKEEPK